MKNLVVKIVCILIALITNLSAQTIIMQENFEATLSPTITSTPNTGLYNGYPSSCADDLWYVAKTSNSTYTCSNCTGKWAQIEYTTCSQYEILYSPTFSPSINTIQISFDYYYNDYYTSPSDYFNVYLYNETKGSNVQTLVSHKGSDYDGSYSGTVTLSGLHEVTDNYRLKFHYYGNDCFGASIDNILVVETKPISSYPHTDDFEGGTLGGWKQSTDDNMDFTIHQGGTPSNGTGPTAAFEGSYYIYTEATGNYNKTAFIDIDLDLTALTDPVISFAYHMYGSKQGKVKLQFSLDQKMFFDLGWSLSGDQGNAWIQEAIDLSILQGTAPTLRFHTTTGPGYTSDFCLDDFCFSSGGGCTPLPIELLYFDAKLKNNQVICNFATATEINTDYFVIQRTTDGINFENIDSIIAAETSFETLHYQLSDKNPLLGTSYYRLKQYDLNGTSESFPLHEVYYTITDIEVNQHKDYFQVIIPNNTSGVINVFNSVGKVVLSQNIEGPTNISVNHFPKGIYFLTVNENNNMYTQQIGIY